MKTLNLVYSDKSDIKYKINKFPDGQQNIVIESFQTKFGTAELQLPIQIKSRMNNFIDLELIICSVASLKELGVKEILLYTPYILGSRSDRKFEKGGNNYLKDVICPIINLLKFESVTCIDPHSDVLEACINNFNKLDNKELLGFAISNIYGLSKDIHRNLENCVLISPDTGASKKIYKLAEQINYKGDIITCSKDRDKDGKLTKCIVPLNIDTNGNSPYKNKDFIIIDDICDGGNTFINIAKTIKEYNIFTSKIYLIITYGIFSKGFYELQKYFDGIYTTNGYKTIEGIMNKSIEMNFNKKELVKQLNIF